MQTACNQKQRHAHAPKNTPPAAAMPAVGTHVCATATTITTDPLLLITRITRHITRAVVQPLAAGWHHHHFVTQTAAVTACRTPSPPTAALKICPHLSPSHTTAHIPAHTVYSASRPPFNGLLQRLLLAESAAGCPRRWPRPRAVSLCMLLAHSWIISRMARLGKTWSLRSGAPETGSVWCCRIHSISAGLLKEPPEGVTTG
jgi:hypothetical protein